MKKIVRKKVLQTAAVDSYSKSGPAMERARPLLGKLSAESKPPAKGKKNL